jgi:hypothetical protein
MEIARRILLVLSACVGLGLLYLAALDPVVMVKPREEGRVKTPVTPDLPSEPREAPGMSLLSPEDRARIQKNRQPVMIRVKGVEWEGFFRNVTDTVEGRERGREWTRRFPSERHAPRVLFFRPHEPPLDQLDLSLTKKNHRTYLVLDEDGPARYLEVDYRTYSDRDFRVGSGFNNYPEPPSYLLYPHRQAGFLVLAAGVALYALLPVRRRYPGALKYDRWRVIMGDIVGVSFLALPVVVSMVVVGGTLQAFSLSGGLLVFLLFSPMSLGGLLVLWVSAWYGGYQIVPAAEGLRIVTVRGERLYRYGDMSFFQPVVFVPPRWLIILSWVMVIMSAGAAIGAAGRALMLSSSSAGSIGIRLKGKVTLFIAVTDQMGGTALKGFQGIVETLRERGVRESAGSRTIRSLGFEALGFEKAEDI